MDNNISLRITIGLALFLAVATSFGIIQMLKLNNLSEQIKQQGSKQGFGSCWECNLDKAYFIDQIYGSREQKVIFKSTAEEEVKIVADIYHEKEGDWEKKQRLDILDANSIETFEPKVMWGGSRLEIKYQVDDKSPVIKGLGYSTVDDKYRLFTKGQISTVSGNVYYEDKYLYDEDSVVDRIDTTGMTNDEVISLIEDRGYDLPNLVIGIGELSQDFQLINDEVVFTEIVGNESAAERDRFHLNYINNDGKFLKIANDWQGQAGILYSFSMGEDKIYFDGLGYGLTRNGTFEGKELRIDAFFSRDYSAEDVLGYLHIR